MANDRSKNQQNSKFPEDRSRSQPNLEDDPEEFQEERSRLANEDNILEFVTRKEQDYINVLGRDNYKEYLDYIRSMPQHYLEQITLELDKSIDYFYKAIRVFSGTGVAGDSIALGSALKMPVPDRSGTHDYSRNLLPDNPEVAYKLYIINTVINKGRRIASAHGAGQGVEDHSIGQAKAWNKWKGAVDSAFDDSNEEERSKIRDSANGALSKVEALAKLEFTKSIEVPSEAEVKFASEEREEKRANRQKRRTGATPAVGVGGVAAAPGVGAVGAVNKRIERLIKPKKLRRMGDNLPHAVELAHIRNLEIPIKDKVQAQKLYIKQHKVVLTSQMKETIEALRQNKNVLRELKTSNDRINKTKGRGGHYR